jgi:hypothetical protein
MTFRSPDPHAVLVTPDALDLLAGHATALGDQVETIGRAAAAALASLTSAVPGSATAAGADAAGTHGPQLLDAEAARLRGLGAAMAAAAESYRDNERRLVVSTRRRP